MARPTVPWPLRMRASTRARSPDIRSMRSMRSPCEELPGHTRSPPHRQRTGRPLTIERRSGQPLNLALTQARHGAQGRGRGASAGAECALIMTLTNARPSPEPKPEPNPNPNQLPIALASGAVAVTKPISDISAFRHSSCSRP